ncbi:MAG: cytochrome c [Gammaproteobacteria bacterium]|jgi:cytochrome c556
MKFTTRLCLLTIGLGLAAQSFAARDPNEDAIKARQAQMQLRSFNAGPLFGMARGKIDYDAALAGKLAGNLKLMLDLDNSRAWAAGTDNEAYPGKTSALPKIWETYPEIADYGKKYKEAVIALASAAGNGVDALRPAVGDLGKACKGCHDNFREKK